MLCEKDCAPEKGEISVFKVIGMMVAFIALFAGAVVAVAVVLKKIRKAIAQINIDTDFEPLDEEDLTATGDAGDEEEADDGCRVGEEAEEAE